jgi:hypothetical protein
MSMRASRIRGARRGAEPKVAINAWPVVAFEACQRRHHVGDHGLVVLAANLAPAMPLGKIDHADGQ